MKKLIGIFVFMLVVNLVSGQKSIDALFNKYEGRDGFTTVRINGNLLKLASFFIEDDERSSIPAFIDELRILSQEDEAVKTDNFYKLVIKDLNLDDYDEFMRVKDSNEEMRMLVRSEGNRFKEFLLIAGGETNAIIQIKGNMTYGEAIKFSKDMKKNKGKDLVSDYN